MSDIAEQMRSDWNRRALEDAHYYVAFGRREQEDAEFEATAADVVRDLARELRRLGRPAELAAMKALEIGCGPGRVLLPMSRRFGEMHGVDVSDEMIRQARLRLARSPNVHAHVNNGQDLGDFASESFDFVYSYAVFQHIPSREVVFHYLREAWRVLRPGGLIRCQINGLAESSGGYDTWRGVRIGASEIAAFAREEDFQLLALEGAGTQYMWVTLRKQNRGWHDALRRSMLKPAARVHRLTNAFGTEPLATCRGRFASIVLWTAGVPDECDLLHLEATVGTGKGTPFYVGPVENDGLRQINVSLPEGIPTGLHPVQLIWLGRLLCPAVTLRVVPPGPAAPRLLSISDAVDLLAGSLIRSGIIKVIFEEVDHVEELKAWVDGRSVDLIDTFCVDPVPARYEVNLHLPPDIPKGWRRLDLWLGRRRFSPVLIEIQQLCPEST